VDLAYQRQQALVLDLPGRAPASRTLVVGGRRHAQGAADELDPEIRASLLNERAHLDRVGSSSLAKNTEGGLQDLVRLAQLTHLAAECLELLTLAARQLIAARAGIGLGPAHPCAQRLRADTEISRYLRDRSARLEHESHRPLTQLVGVPLLG